MRIAVVGTGPAGFYMAKNILRNVENVRVDLFDRNPHPFGLIRTGVAPDHQAMKNIQNDFTQVLQNDKCAFFGNVLVGRPHEAKEQGCSSISVPKLREMYSAVVLAYGATSDRLLGLDRELETVGVFPARRIVDWYNGSLDDILKPEEFDLEHIRSVAIVGNGNIATDIARILTKNPADFGDSDTPSSVLETLRKSKLNTI